MTKKNQTYSKETIKRHFNQSNGFGEHKGLAIELLKQTVSLLSSYEIAHCLISGTLLGQVRHNSFIPWDDDIDLLVDSIIFDKMQKISDSQNQLNLFFKNQEDSIKVCSENGIDLPKNDCVETWKKHCLRTNGNYTFPFVDLFAFKEIHENQISFFHKEWNVNKFFPLKQVNFLGVETFIPKNPEYFLKINYGLDFMTNYESSPYCHKKERKINSIRIDVKELKNGKK